MSIRIGMVGLGSIGMRMLEGIVLHPRFEASRVWDPDLEARRRVGQAYPGITVAAGAGEVMQSADVDLVYIACPPAFHREHALAAIAMGKALLCEKPLGVDLEESRDLVARVESSGLPNAVNLLYGSAGASTLLGEALRADELGSLVWVDAHLHLRNWAARRYAEAPWLAERAQGGFLREVTTHYVYLCQRLLGGLELRTAHVDFPADGHSAERFADVRLAAGDVPITITGTTAGAGPEVSQVTFWGEKRSYRIRDLHLLESAEGDRWVPVYAPPGRAELDTYARQLDNLAALLDGAAHTMPDFRAALATQEMIESILSEK